MRDERQAYSEKQRRELDRAAREWSRLGAALVLLALRPRASRPTKRLTKRGALLVLQAAALLGLSIGAAALLGESIPVEARDAVLVFFGAVLLASFALAERR
jgi:uncharacterized membrane protein